MKPIAALSGIELDAAVCAEVLNLDIDKVHPEDWPWWDHEEAQRGKQVQRIPEFSSDWNAAKDVVEKILEDRRVNVYLSTDIDHRWTCIIEKHDANDGIVGKTLPEAICRAAL